MTQAFTFDRESARRIQNAVLTVEAWRRSGGVPGGGRRQRQLAAALPQVAVAVADIEHGAIGLVKKGEGSAFDSSVAPVGDELEAYNPGPKIWGGSRLAIENWALRGAGVKWVVRQAWSATRIRGTADATIPPGTSGALSDVLGLDGGFSSTTAEVLLPTAHVSIAAGMVVWAELVYVAANGSSRWEVYSADCDELAGA